jgi:uncharacterized membrane protein
LYRTWWPQALTKNLRPETALGILKKRYAQGEISKDQFEEVFWLAWDIPG